MINGFNLFCVGSSGKYSDWFSFIVEMNILLDKSMSGFPGFFICYISRKGFRADAEHNFVALNGNKGIKVIQRLSVPDINIRLVHGRN